MLTAGLVLALYFWAYFAGLSSIEKSLLVSDWAAAFAGAAILIALISYFWTPKKHIFWGILAAYLLLGLTVATLILATDGTNSPFLALGMLVIVFAPVFGGYGLVPVIFGIAAYATWLIINDEGSSASLLTLLLVGGLPLAAGYLLWRNGSHESVGSQGRAYRQLANELSQVAGQAEVVINAITDGVIALDAQGTIQLINPAAQSIIGWGKQDALALNYKSVLRLVDKDNQELEPSVDPIAQALATNREVLSRDFSLITNSNKKIQISINVSPVGQLGSGVIVVFRDITSEKAEEREQAEFISTASHEMRTPVASIEGYLGLALNPAIARIDDKARDYIVKAQAAAQHLGRLFQDLLDISKAEDGRLTNKPKVIDVVAFTHDIVEGLRPKAEAKGLSLIYKPQPDDEEPGNKRINPVYYANVDNDHLREVIANVVDNAIKYTPSGTVVVDVGGNNERVTISVADSGIGIPPEDLGHLFQKFYRVDNSDTREIGGTGLGLYLCRRLTEAMGGRIWAESEYHKGSTFYIEIPRTDHEEAMRIIESVKPTIMAEPDSIPTPQIDAATSSTPVYNQAVDIIANEPAAVESNGSSAPGNAAPVAETVEEPASATGPDRTTTPPASPPIGDSPQVYSPISPEAAKVTLDRLEQNPAEYLSRPNLRVPPRR